MAFRTKINVNGNVFSTSPGCFVRFVRFVYRDTLNQDVLHTEMDRLGLSGIVHDEQPQRTMTAEILDGGPDVLECSVSKSKDRAAGSFSITLAPGNINYHAALHPGDHVLIFMKRDAGAGFEITNEVSSGLKMWGIIQSVRVTRDSQGTGAATVRYLISGLDFGHFMETDIYFNHIIAEQFKDETLGMLHYVLNFVIDLDYSSPSTNIQNLLDAFIGGFNLQGLPSDFATPDSANAAFSLPNGIASFFGGKRLVSVLQRQIGVLQYGEEATVPLDRPPALTGTKFINIDTGSAFSLWSVIEAYGNALVNEFYMDLKPSESGKLVPTLVARQVPFTSINATSMTRKNRISLATTAYISLPRVTIPEEIIFREDLGRSEAQRFNYIQLWGTGQLYDGSGDFQPEQTQKGNFAIDRQSIRRYGVKSLVRTTDYDLDLQSLRHAQKQQRASDGSITFITDWTQIYADWHLPSHTFESGTIQTIGIEEPLAIGDNIEIIRIDKALLPEIYHIQSYSHSFSVDASGVKQFRTTIAVVRGQLENEKPIYSQVKHIGDPDLSHRGQTTTTRVESDLTSQTTLRNPSANIDFYKDRWK